MITVEDLRILVFFSKQTPCCDGHILAERNRHLSEEDVSSGSRMSTCDVGACRVCNLGCTMRPAAKLPDV